LLLLFLFRIVAEEVTILTHSLGIHHLICVLALGCKGASSIQVIAMIAHALGIMLGFCVRTSGDLPLFSAGLRVVLLILFSGSAASG
jgi:hypothetical protein